MKTRVLAALSAAALLSGSVLTAASASADPAQFQDCLARNGVTAKLGPPPKGSKPPAKGQIPPAPPGVDAGVWKTAYTACAKFDPNRPPPK